MFRRETRRAHGEGVELRRLRRELDALRVVDFSLESQRREQRAHALAAHAAAEDGGGFREQRRETGGRRQRHENYFARRFTAATALALARRAAHARMKARLLAIGRHA